MDMIPLEALTIPHGIPARVDAAQQFLFFATGIQNGPHPCDGVPATGRDLSPKEGQVYDAALDVLFSYFTGEMDYGDCQVTQTAPPDDETPQRVPVAS
jgi:hypothetical protein